MRYLTAFGLNDLKNIRRESLLWFLLLMPWVIVIMLRLLIPGIGNWLEATYGITLEQYYPLILSFFIILEIPLIFGLVFGFLILDEKDDRVLIAMQVTPVTVGGYAFYRFLTTVLLCMFYLLAALNLTGLIALPEFYLLLLVAFMGGLFAVFIILLLISTADNKVEGLALMKAMGIIMMGPLAAYFMESKWQLLFGILPSYWPAKSFWLITGGENPWAYILGGIAYISLLLILLGKRFNTKLRLLS